MIDLLFSLGIATLVRATALVAAIALVLAVFRIRSSSTRHTAWVAALVVMMLLPVLTRVVPPIRVSMPERAVPSLIEPLVHPPVRMIDTPFPALPRSMTPQGSTAPPVAPPGVEQPGPAPRSPVAPVPWDVIVAVAYLTGLAFLLVRFAIGLTQLASIRRQSRPVTTSDGQVMWESALVATPVTIGLLSPRVIVPTAWREWPREMMTGVLAHERAHCARRDPLIAMLARLNTSLFWFHPLAWWLERQLGTLAEHACDEAALTQVPRRQYAETLLDIATTARRHNGRLLWQGVGVDGNGRLGQRIDLVLSGESWPKASPVRRAMVAASCATAIAIAVACQQEVKVEPLREDPAVAAKMKENLDRNKAYWADRGMSLEQADALEKALEKNPEDTATREKLLRFYQWTGNNKQSWNENVAARRRHALWLVEHHPDSSLVWNAPVTRATDPEGYEQLRSRWSALIAPPDVDLVVLSNAAFFFAQSDIRKAEELLLRGRERANGQDARWGHRLGELYALAIVPPSGKSQDPASAVWARQRLSDSTDASVLATAGRILFSQQSRELGRSYVERAGRLQGPAAQSARNWIRLIDDLERDQLNVVLRAPQSEWRGIIDKSTGVMRIRQLAALADQAYSMSEYYDWRAKQPAGSPDASPDAKKDNRMAAEGFANAKQNAREAIEVAPSLNGAGVGEAAFNAHMVYGLVLLREGNRKGALEHLQASAKLPVSGGQPVGGWASGNEYRLVFYLLKNGERQTIIDYFERAAQGRDEARRKVMLASAAAIRDGRMPQHYQWLLANGSI